MFRLRMRLLAVSMSLATSVAFAGASFAVPAVQAAPMHVADQVPGFPDLPSLSDLPSLPGFSDGFVFPTQEPEPTATPTPKPTATATPEPTATATPKPTPTEDTTNSDNSTGDNSDIFNQMQSFFDGYTGE